MRWRALCDLADTLVTEIEQKFTPCGDGVGDRAELHEANGRFAAAIHGELTAGRRVVSIFQNKQGAANARAGNEAKWRLFDCRKLILNPTEAATFRVSRSCILHQQARVP